MTENRAYKRFVNGVDAHQARARQSAGIPLVERGALRSQEIVEDDALVAVECASCGCTNAWPASAKSKVCAFCGAKHKPVGYVPPRWER